MSHPQEGSSSNLPVPRLSRGVLTRDFLIFELKLVLDGLIDLVMAPLGAIAFVSELIFPGRLLGSRFYAVLRMGERWDRWLSLYQPAKEAETSGDGLLGSTTISADSLIGTIEDLIRQGRLPKSAREILDRVPKQEPRGADSGDQTKKREDP